MLVHDWSLTTPYAIVFRLRAETIWVFATLHMLINKMFLGKSQDFSMQQLLARDFEK